MHEENNISDIIGLLPSTTFEVFQACASTYPEVDTNWGNDIDMIREFLQETPSSMILDAGCGTAKHMIDIALQNNRIPTLTGIDYSSNMLNEAQNNIIQSCLNERINLIMADITNLPFSNSSYDLVLCLNNVLGNLVAHNIKDTVKKRLKALNELTRVLRNGGLLMLTVYNNDTLHKVEKYGDSFCVKNYMSGDIDQDYIVLYKGNEYSNRPLLFYSHWFNLDELLSMLYFVHLTPVHIENRFRRIVIIAKSDRS